MNRKNRIEKKLIERLNPIYIDVVNESHRHHVAENAQTHFKVTVVSAIFEGRALIKRHRLVNDLVAEERETGLHALSLHLKTPAEWETQPQTPGSPTCRNGSKYG